MAECIVVGAASGRLDVLTLRCGGQDFVSGDEVESLSPEEMVQLFDDFCSHRWGDWLFYQYSQC